MRDVNLQDITLRKFKMKLLVLDTEIKSFQKTIFIRTLESILIRNKIISSSQLQEFRGITAYEISQELGFLSKTLQENALKIV